MAGYLVFDIEITDPEAWQHYREVAGPVMAASGGEFLVQSAGIEPLEGGWHPASLSVVAFPSAEAARAFYHSDAYQALLPLREAAAISRGVLVTGA
ncbi:DUF1330 domain-containing protein [Maritimibacter fusiformis]|uniref:DUF1330 domain-containing protein n=1 Tax=Maritimibacter fusiformis TaxID=2603819 RepID=A0A5D0RRN2_9RHOB|nr:DUF1330 domain-containing protein [Maritimibacter fusiformis]TYB83181.1 DUF1330 domain-containing protein [Maritimibacter fusiformis]